MSAQSTKHELQKLERVGRLLARRLQEARRQRGLLRCPRCQELFDGTHLLKCPACRTLISKAFQKVPVPTVPEKMELDFFSVPPNVGNECQNTVDKITANE